MAETTTSTLSLPMSFKRLREEDEEIIEDSKRLKSSSSYNEILSFLEEDEDEPNQDLSSLMTSLQQEISSEPTSEAELTTQPNKDSSSSSDNEEDKEGVIKHLLEASDDELGIPNSEIRVEVDDYDEGITGGGGVEFSLCDGLWEFEDETANYYTLLQSELFM